MEQKEGKIRKKDGKTLNDQLIVSKELEKPLWGDLFTIIFSYLLLKELGRCEEVSKLFQQRVKYFLSTLKEIKIVHEDGVVSLHELFQHCPKIEKLNFVNCNVHLDDFITKDTGIDRQFKKLELGFTHVLTELNQGNGTVFMLGPVQIDEHHKVKNTDIFYQESIMNNDKLSSFLNKFKKGVETFVIYTSVPYVDYYNEELVEYIDWINIKGDDFLSGLTENVKKSIKNLELYHFYEFDEFYQNKETAEAIGRIIQMLPNLKSLALSPEFFEVFVRDLQCGRLKPLSLDSSKLEKGRIVNTKTNRSIELKKILLKEQKMDLLL